MASSNFRGRGLKAARLINMLYMTDCVDGSVLSSRVLAAVAIEGFSCVEYTFCQCCHAWPITNALHHPDLHATLAALLVRPFGACKPSLSPMEGNGAAWGSCHLSIGQVQLAATVAHRIILIAISCLHVMVATWPQGLPAQLPSWKCGTQMLIRQQSRSSASIAAAHLLH